ncbi:MAG TPA: hypothetical protein VHZ54_04575 [Solirubrobacterales bacterium]|nr:hypothetical protein [Solirubrobacterales bacterium]
MSTAEIPEVTVRLNASYHLHSIHRMVNSLRPIYDLESPTIVRLDLEDLSFISPANLAYMVAVMRRGRENGTVADGSVIVNPAKPRVRTYLHRMDVLRVLFEKEPNDPTDPIDRQDVAGLKECVHFASEPGGRKVAGDLAKATQEEVETDTFAAASLELALIELTENVHFHADAEFGGFAAAQTFKNSKEIEVAIVDLGVGISQSLSQNPEYEESAADDVGAIKEALKPLVTANPERNRGYGLAFTRFLLEYNDGRLIVWSGNGWVQVGEEYVEKEKDFMPGTLVVLRLHTDRPFDFQHAYGKLTEAIEEIEGATDDDVRELRNETGR